jgi:NAD(P) transhydrogenase subunit beta
MDYTNLSYVLSSVLFILGIKKLSHPKTARSGNLFAAIAMFIAIIATLVSYNNLDYKIIFIGIAIGSIIGAVFAIKVEMTQMPQMVAIFNGFGGAASALVAAAEYLNLANGPSNFTVVTIILSIFIGTLTFTGSFIAFGKLQGFISGQPIVFPGQQIFNSLIAMGLIVIGYLLVQTSNDLNLFYLIIGLSALLGVTLTIPIGGADMPVVISLLNSYSGIAASATGFVLMNNGLIISGALVGASGFILTSIMCKGMNRSLTNVIFGAMGLEQESSSSGEAKQVSVKSYSTEEAAMIFEAAEKVIVVPGYGLAVAQAQHAVREVAEFLESKGKKVLYAIHPVAGRMPGHMNVLLAEANIPYEQLKDLGNKLRI